MHLGLRENVNNLKFNLKIKVLRFFSYIKHIIKLKTFYLWISIKNIDICDISDTSQVSGFFFFEYARLLKLLCRLSRFQVTSEKRNFNV